MPNEKNYMNESKRVYENDEMTVFWNSEICQHAMECVKGNSEVFKPTRQPWIDLSKAESNEIASIIDRCPSGALKYEKS